jgi:hypothetical protein
VSYAAQALAVVRKTPLVKFFGRATRFVVNCTPDYAVRYDLEGRPVETLTRAYCPESLGRVIGTIPQVKRIDSSPVRIPAG